MQDGKCEQLSSGSAVEPGKEREGIGRVEMANFLSLGTCSILSFECE
jgi:hypothetical protein